MKKELNIKLTIDKRTIYTLVVFSIFILIGIVTIFAYGTSSPTSFGHSAGELDLSSGVAGNAIFNDNVGIGTSPNAKLDINGEFKIGNTGVSCSSNIEGALRYNTTDSAVEYCNGTVWNVV